MPRASDARSRIVADQPVREPPLWAIAAVLTAAIWIVYGRSLPSPWIFDDRHSVVFDNPSIRSLWPLLGNADHPGPLRPPTENPMSARPLVNWSLAMNYRFGGTDPRGYHFVNTWLHVINSLLVYGCVWRTLRLPRMGERFGGPAKWLASIVALLWALHPLSSEAVVYVTQRTELKVTLFYLSTLYASLRYWNAESPAHRRRWLALAVVAGFAGAASKEVMVSAPLVVWLFDWTFVSGSWRDTWRRHGPLYAGLATSWALLAALQIGTPRGESAGFGLGVELVDYWCTQAEIFVTYFKLAIWPAPLALHYEWRELETLRTAWPYVVAVVAVILATLWLLVSRRPTGALLAAMLLILAPTHIIPITTEIAAERRMYLPLAAFIALAVCGAYWLLTRRAPINGATKPPPAVIVLALVLALVYGVVAASRAAAYLDPIAIWRENVVLQPFNVMARSNLASHLIESGNRQEAIEHLRTALDVEPDFSQGRYQLAMALAGEGELDAAAAELQKVVDAKPEAYKLRNNLGVLLYSAGRYPEAIVQFEKVLELQPDFVEAQDNLNRARRASVLPTDAE